MNNKMAINTYQQLNLKNKLSKQDKKRQNRGYREHFDGCQVGEGCGGMDEEVRGLRSTNKLLQNSHRDVQYSIENGVTKEFIPMTDGHEQWCGDGLRE